MFESWPNVSFRDVSRFVGSISAMHQVLEGRGQLRSKYLQMIINLRHFHDCSWDKRIFCIGDTIFKRAKAELEFWIVNLDKLNFRPFISPPPNVVAWADASAFAAGGLVCELKKQVVGMYRPITADNLLLPITSMSGLGALRDCDQWLWIVMKER